MTSADAPRSPAATLPPPPPMPSSAWPLVGHLPRLRSQGLIGFLEESWRQEGDVFRFKMGAGETIVVAHPRGLEHILATARPNYIKGEAYDGVRKVIGDGVLALEGDAWFKRRRLMAPSFHRAALVSMAKTMVDFGAAYFDKIRARAKDGDVVDFHRMMVEVTLDIVVATLFGKDLIESAHVNPDALAMALELITHRANGLPIPDWLPTRANRRAKATMLELDTAVFRVIAAARAQKEQAPTLLTMLLNTVDEETGEKLTDRELRNEVLTLFLAGHETTALTLAWLFVLLSDRGDVVAKMRAEVQQVLGDRDPEFADVPKLKYVRQVLDESLRLRGPVAMVGRTAVNDDEIQGFRIPKGALVMPYFWGVHRHRDFWKDADTFDPERFSEENSKGRDPWCYLPFSGGQRICIGNTFSLMESTMLIAMILRRFDVELAIPAHTIVPTAIATVRPSRPVDVRLRWR